MMGHSSCALFNLLLIFWESIYKWSQIFITFLLSKCLSTYIRVDFYLDILFRGILIYHHFPIYHPQTPSDCQCLRFSFHCWCCEPYKC